MPGGMTASFAPAVVTGADVDGMPVGFMNAGGHAGQMPGASPADMGQFQDMPAGGMPSGAHARSSAMLGEMPRAGSPPTQASGTAAFEEMPRGDSAPGRSSDPSADGAVALVGEWRLQLTVRGQTT